ncbi:hypothetical protein HAX54_007262, partial [Datura stramonium]|nr:hypothetical protein [Datura stramonium]
GHSNEECRFLVQQSQTTTGTLHEREKIKNIATQEDEQSANRYEVLGDDQGVESVIVKEEDTVQEEVSIVGREVDTITVLEVSQLECKDGEINDEQSRSKEEKQMSLVEVGIENKKPVNTFYKYIDKKTNMTHDGAAERIFEDEENKMELMEVVKEDAIPLNTMYIYIMKDTNKNNDGFTKDSSKAATQNNIEDGTKAAAQNNGSKLPNAILHSLVTHRVADWENEEKKMIVIDDKDNNAATMSQGEEEDHSKEEKQSPKTTNNKRSKKSKETGITQPNRIVTRSSTNKAIYKS